MTHRSTRSLRTVFLAAIATVATMLTPGPLAAPLAAATPPAAAEPSPQPPVAAPPSATPPAQTPPSTNPATTAPPAATPPASTPPAPTTPTAPAAPADAPPKPPIFAVFECDSGSFRAELAIKQAPRLCANFINLANRGYFDGKPWGEFSRVVRQTGINPGGDPAYTLPRELSKDLFFDKPGRLCYSNNSDDVATARAKPTRIFITVRPQDRWNLQYAVFGTIVDGLDVAFNLKEGEKIIRVRIEGDFASHQARYAKQIAEWNAALDKVGLTARR